MFPPGIEPFVAVTDQNWFDYLASAAVTSRLLAELDYDSVVAPEEFAPSFELVEADGRHTR